jgi:homoserine kinase
MRAVNAIARDQCACGVAAVAYIRDTTVDTMAMQDRLVQIVRINIVAGFNGSAWRRVSDTVQYAVLEGEGESI